MPIRSRIRGRFQSTPRRKNRESTCAVRQLGCPSRNESKEEILDDEEGYGARTRVAGSIYLQGEFWCVVVGNKSARILRAELVYPVPSTDTTFRRRYSLLKIDPLETSEPPPLLRRARNRSTGAFRDRSGNYIITLLPRATIKFPSAYCGSRSSTGPADHWAKKGEKGFGGKPNVRLLTETMGTIRAVAFGKDRSPETELARSADTRESCEPGPATQDHCPSLTDPVPCHTAGSSLIHSWALAACRSLDRSLGFAARSTAPIVVHAILHTFRIRDLLTEGSRQG